MRGSIGSEEAERGVSEDVVDGADWRCHMICTDLRVYDSSGAANRMQGPFFPPVQDRVLVGGCEERDLWLANTMANDFRCSNWVRG